MYLLTNDSFKHVKIGFTERSPKERAKELSSATGVPTDFRVSRDWFVPADRVRSLEIEIHRNLRRAGYHHRKEFFAVNIQTAVKFVEEALRRNNLLELAQAKEDERHSRLDEYYQRKHEKARQVIEQGLSAARQAAIVSQLDSFRLDLQLRLSKRHPIRMNVLPLISAIAGATSTLLYGLLTKMPWYLLLIMCGGGWLLGHGLFDSSANKFVQRRHGLLIDKRVELARMALEACAYAPSDFPSSAEYRRLIEDL